MNWDHVAHLAPIATAGIAFSAFLAAIFAIFVQKNIAKKRAALDLFLKTELDRTTVDSLDVYMKALKRSAAASDNPGV